ncbi:DNA-binding transcriptional regulator, AcrR family [Actinopolymorpha singaporensis]|uniref:DNA-binding transcriptional regulator, AcrR family n=1 Tax=Actinopolymorpha singaporensis TaxID=117157 RepID=A0A1H1TI97_9ACTN|nr:DNA-binding transcriptional regulator, AcrR family [Actinopolymorpha singaporensis]
MRCLGTVTARQAGLREQKKQATREALRAAALRLARERGPDNVRVDDIAEAAGVSPRTYNNYFSSREQAIVAAVTAERETRVAAAVADRLVHAALADAVVEAVVEQYTAPDDQAREALLLIIGNPGLRNAFVGSAAAIENPLAAMLAERLEGTDDLAAQVLAAGVSAAVRVALRRWLRGATESGSVGGLVVPSGSLPDLLRAALAPLAPALDAAGKRARGPRRR